MVKVRFMLSFKGFEAAFVVVSIIVTSGIALRVL